MDEVERFGSLQSPITRASSSCMISLPLWWIYMEVISQLSAFLMHLVDGDEVISRRKVGKSIWSSRRGI